MSKPTKKDDKKGEKDKGKEKTKAKADQKSGQSQGKDATGNFFANVSDFTELYFPLLITAYFIHILETGGSLYDLVVRPKRPSEVRGIHIAGTLLSLKII